MKKTSNNIVVVFSSDDNYAKYLCVSICSLIENTSDKNNYEIIILDGGISELNKSSILSFVKSNVSIRFIIMANTVKGIKQKLYISGHISEASYYRLFISDILKDYKKIVYTDCDVTFNADVAELYNYPIKSNDIVAAVPDIGLIASSGMAKDMDYYHEVIGVKSIDKYFNSGVLVMNLDQMRKIDLKQKFVETLDKLPTPKYHDQCILNIICLNRVTYLPFKYNYWGNFKYENPGYEKYFPEPFLTEFLKASKKPSIIHYKPWQLPKDEMASIFWKYARMTPFYEEILYNNIFDIDYIMNYGYRKRKKWAYNILYKLTHINKFKTKRDRVIKELKHL